jgi:hypothetical protein
MGEPGNVASFGRTHPGDANFRAPPDDIAAKERRPRLPHVAEEMSVKR